LLCSDLRSTWYRIVDLKIAVAKSVEFGTAVSAECRLFHALIYDFLIDAIEIVWGVQNNTLAAMLCRSLLLPHNTKRRD
jgi:hypothetical protein